jgi:hypothetical protein
MPILIACGGFLIAVLWMDLMFDVQVRPFRPADDLPEAVLASVAGYYRRVTTEATPMNRVIGAVMMVGMVAMLVQLINGPRGRAIASIFLLGGPVALAQVRVVPNAVRLGSRADSAPIQSALARAIFRDHLLCLAAVAAFLTVQLAPITP